MKRKIGFLPAFLAALSLCLWTQTPFPVRAENIVGPPNAIFCNKNSNSVVLSAGTTQLIVGVTGQVINVCGYVFSGAGTGTLQYEFGTGATCTSPTLLTAVFTTAAGNALQDHFSYAWASSAPGQSLCVVTTGAATVASAAIYYSQF